MPNDKISAKLAVIFCITMMAGTLYNLPYCVSVSFFLFLLFSYPMRRRYFQKKRVKLGIEKDDRSNVCITRKQYLSLYVTSAVIGIIFNVAAVFYSAPDYLIVGIDIVIAVICNVIDFIMKRSLIREEQS